MNDINAIIGATCSGKSSLALKLAIKFNLDIFSIDSLSVYKYVDIASAKPSKMDLNTVKHYGIDILEPSEKCSVKLFFDLLKTIANSKILIVGGSSFYLKTIIDGLVPMPPITEDIQNMVSNMLADIDRAYVFLKNIDNEYASRINSSDKYRIARGLEVFFLTNTPPSLYFKSVSKEKLPFSINVFELIKTKDLLVSDIEARTKNMISCGLIDEVIFLKNKYKNSQIFKAIGIKEVISYIDGAINKDDIEHLINKNTVALAKRQRTFNNTQFSNVMRGDEKTIMDSLRHI